MANAPRWLWTLIAGLLVGAGGTGAIALKILPFENSSSPEIISETPDPLKNLVIIVKDSKTKKVLNNADIEITYEEGIIPGRTLDDGTYRLQIPPQDLGAVKILVRREGYQQKEIPKDFAVNPNEPLTIYLNLHSISDTSQIPGENPSPPESPASSTTKPIKTSSEIPSLEWSDSPYSLKISKNLDQDFPFICPSGGSTGRIYGTNTYTSLSSICTAAVHSGLINAKDGGQVTIRIQGVQESYKGTISNGVESRRYGKYNGSFIFVK